MADIDTILSVEEVAARVPDELEAYEIVDGQVLLTVGAMYPHQHVIVELGYDLTGWARGHAARVIGQPFDVQTTRTRRRQPGLIVVLAERRDRIGREGMRGAPDLVVEVLSASTRTVDLGDKRVEYAGLGVAEYWCIDPDAGEALLARPPGAPWQRLGRDDTLTSPLLPGFSIALDALLPP